MLQERGGDSNIQGLVLIIIIVVVAIVIAIVVLTMVEFCGGTVVAPVVPGIILAASKPQVAILFGLFVEPLPPYPCRS